MTVRTTSKTVTFMHPFNLSGMDEVQPAGTYTVETDEELLRTSSLPAYRRISTLMRLPAGPAGPAGPMVTQIVEVNPLELAAVLSRDHSQYRNRRAAKVSCVGKALPAGCKSSVKAGDIGLPSTPMTWLGRH
jgi:hypothetical protein